MGYLAIKDTGFISIQTSNEQITGVTGNAIGAQNIADNNGIINLKTFSLSSNTGKNIDAKGNIAGNVSRINMGSAKATPVTLNSYLSRKPNKYEANIIKYLMAWSRSRTVLMLFYMPNDNSVTLQHGQEPDFFTSQLKNLYDLLWDKNLGSDPYGDTTYGSSRFRTGYTHQNQPYDACALPIIIDDVTFTEEANTTALNVNITGYIMENEGK